MINWRMDIESTKVDIRNKLPFPDKITEKTVNHAMEIFVKCGKDGCFGRGIVIVRSKVAELG